MGMFDIFVDGANEAQIKCLRKSLVTYHTGDDLSIELAYHKFPEACTLADRGGISTKFPEDPIFGTIRHFGIFVVIENGIFTRITLDDSEIVYPIYNKYGYILKIM